MAEKKVEMRIFGMTCEDCAFTIKTEMERIGAKDVRINLEKGEGSLTMDESILSREKILSDPIFSEKSHYKAQIRKVE